MLSQKIETLLTEALEDRLAKKEPGPIVTISREYGCPGLKLGKSLSQELSSRRSLMDGRGSWECLDREIIQQAARIVNLPPELVEKISAQEPPGWLAGLVNAFQTHYLPSDVEIKRAVGWVIRGLSYLGRFVIVGRGGAVITGDVKNALHVRLYAPQSWRVKSVMQMHGTDERNALKIIQDIDRERIYLRNFFSGEQAEEDSFDVEFNCQTFSEAEILKSVLLLLELRKFIAPAI